MKLLFALIVLCYTVIGYGQSWHQTDTLPPVNRYDDIYFLDDLRGWAVNSAGGIYKTTTGGEAWYEVLSPDSSGYLRSIEFISDSIGFAGSLSAEFFRSTDAGESWYSIADSIHGNFEGICGMSHVGDHVFGVGLYSRPAYFIRSADRGVTWTYKDMSAYATGLVECHFTDALHGYVTGSTFGEGAIILQTADGGDTWETVFTAPDNYAYVWKLFFATPQIGYGSIEDFSGKFSIARTLDGGDTWEQLYGPAGEFDIQGIGFDSPLHGWVSPRTNRLYETHDGGETWQPSTVLQNINRFFQVPGGRLYASGSQVYYLDEAIGVNEFEAPMQNHSITTEPNPFSSMFTVYVQIDVRTDGQISIIDVGGRHFLQLYSGPLAQGRHHFTVDTERLSIFGDQPLIVVLGTDEGFISRKVIRITR